MSLPPGLKKENITNALEGSSVPHPSIVLPLPGKWVRDCELYVHLSCACSCPTHVCVSKPHTVLGEWGFFLISFSLLTQISRATWYVPGPLYYLPYSLSLSSLAYPIKHITSVIQET